MYIHVGTRMALKTEIIIYDMPDLVAQPLWIKNNILFNASGWTITII